MNATQVKVLVLLLALVGGLGAILAPWQNAEDRARLELIAGLQGEWVGRQAPEFDLPDLQGTRHTLAQYRGRVIFLNFWGSFCAPCREEMPSMERLVRQYQDRGLTMIAITFDPKVEDARSFMKEFLPGQRSAMTVLHDPTSQIGVEFGTDLLPETYIIDQQGRIVARFVNKYDWTRQEVKTLIENLLTDSESSRTLL